MRGYQIHEGFYPQGLSGLSWRPACPDQRRKADAIQAAKAHPWHARVTEFGYPEIVFDNGKPNRKE